MPGDTIAGMAQRRAKTLGRVIGGRQKTLNSTIRFQASSSQTIARCTIISAAFSISCTLTHS